MFFIATYWAGERLISVRDNVNPRRASKVLVPCPVCKAEQATRPNADAEEMGYFSDHQVRVALVTPELIQKYERLQLSVAVQTEGRMFMCG